MAVSVSLEEIRDSFTQMTDQLQPVFDYAKEIKVSQELDGWSTESAEAMAVAWFQGVMAMIFKVHEKDE